MLLCTTRKIVKNNCFCPFLVQLGLGFPPPPIKKGLCNQVAFSPQATKLHATVAFVGTCFDKNVATYLVAILLQSKTVILQKKKKSIRPCKLRGKTEFWPKAARGKNRPQPQFPFIFHNRDTLCMPYIQKEAFQLKAIKHCTKMNETPFCCSLCAFKKSPP